MLNREELKKYLLEKENIEMFKNQKHYNSPHFSHKLFFNVKILKII
jgi:hypothetical protein